MAKQLFVSDAFRSLKPNRSLPKLKASPSSAPSNSLPIKSSQSPPSPSTSASKSNSPWSVYLILSTNPPIKTYVGVTTNFTRRLKQHNGDLKGGAKASRSGRPWICACLIGGFKDRSEACTFESRWKQLSKKLPRKGKSNGLQKLEETKSVVLLKHRYAALDQNCSLVISSRHKQDALTSVYTCMYAYNTLELCLLGRHRIVNIETVYNCVFEEKIMAHLIKYFCVRLGSRGSSLGPLVKKM
ncbi:unnamed protein product [Cuscuta campestris]|uniref:GIY-YIG domain-containing protein n=1 Tax=Cuscuta campestris TaxID=132261 RepID=A0A484K7M6_9ASTE|nr:unnamed protein product [Cuscuta campestris]